MVKRRSYSSTDDCFPRSKLLSPRTPKNTPTTTVRFDFSNMTVTPKRRSVSLSDSTEKVMAFKRVCRKYTISTEIAEQLAKIGDEIMKDYDSIFNSFNIASLYQFFDVAMGVKRKRSSNGQQKTSRKRKISGYLGIVILHILTNM
eukprot:TCONS_00052139-protein